MKGRMESYWKMSDSELTAAVHDGDHRAFDALFLRWHPQVLQFILTLVKEQVLAEDLAQSVFIKVWLHRDRLDPSKSLRNYLSVLARNAALDVFKSKKHLLTAQIASAPEQASPERSDLKTEFKETSSLIRQLVEAMPDQRQKIFLMSRYEQLSHEEIALRLGLSVRTVEKHIQLALQDIRKNLN